MKKYIDYARNFGDLSEAERIELLFFASGIPMFLAGSALVLAFDELLIGGLFLAVAILDLTVLPPFLARNVETEA
ncbi:hypothetical protein [Halopiger goleimassiliensis]|uniref:hypothetical protein n=1 Tax=Halopiger goleimassiliensis TaxID=1293048 RepID=UPI0006780C0E|nr:hypothetical protein [Halopiger goleimassiliensis]